MAYKVAALQQVTSHIHNGHSPISLVDSFPEGIPAVFITSKLDRSVPPEGTIKLAKKLAERKKNDVYLLVLEASSHSGYMMDNPEDAKKYLSFMHALYKKYELPYIPQYAKQGEELDIVTKCLL
jgi:hypothetical protein